MYISLYISCLSLKISKTVETQIINRFLTENFAATPPHQVGKDGKQKLSQLKTNIRSSSGASTNNMYLAQE
jgi:hypothetical protein